MMSSSPASSPAPFVMSSAAASTAASSPPPSELVPDSEPMDVTSEQDEKPVLKPLEEENIEGRLARLQHLLDKSTFYANALKDIMDAAKARSAYVVVNASKPKAKKSFVRRKGKKRIRIDSDDENDDEEPSKRAKLEDDAPKTTKFQQPALITGAKLKDYQLEGVEWMISLDQNGISGILADEMGLGKTLQTIAFNAYLRERGFFRPFLVVCPLSVLHNWVEEFQKFAPDIPFCMYHGTPAEREELRKTVMRIPVDEEEKWEGKKGKKKRDDKDDDSAESSPSKAKSKAKAETKSAGEAPKKGIRRSGRFKKVDADEVDEEAVEDAGVNNADAAEEEKDGSAFPVILTTYEILMRDRPHLARYKWGYIVVDEGHRLKNFDCRLMREIKQLSSGGRLILSGTPLHNNLAELWSLLNFILPNIFHDLESFQEWFNLPTLSSTLSSARSSQLIHSLHSILKPFLLRRTKADILDLGLPPKKEYVLYAPLSERQKGVYEVVVGGGLRGFLMGKSKKDMEKDDEKQREWERKKVDVNAPRKLRGGKRRVGDVDGDDDEYFERLEKGEVQEGRRREKEKKAEEIGRDHQYKATLKQVNNMKLQNTVMQLRKVCSHPFLFDWPLDPRTREPVVNEELVGASGKMMVLDRLLGELFKRKHKVLLFSQFTTMLDIIEDWATVFKGWSICRIDGSTAPLERREQMNLFQSGGDAPDAPCLFLLSTRAGGLGINLTAADTVIFYDQDWNPQMDIQAQDRAHRIGQTKPVLIFRLVSKYTIEEKIMQRANEKRKLEALVIAKDKFKMPASAARGKPQTMAEMASSLLRLEGEKIEVVSNGDSVMSDEDLEVLLDRRSEVFVGRGKGWTSKDGVQANKAAFAVYNAVVDEGNDALARMMGEDVEC